MTDIFMYIYILEDSFSIEHSDSSSANQLMYIYTYIEKQHMARRPVEKLLELMKVTGSPKI